MKNLKQFLKDYSVIIVFIVTFILDDQYGIINYYISNTFYQNLIKGLGALILAYFTGQGLKTSFKKGNGSITPDEAP